MTIVGRNPKAVIKLPTSVKFSYEAVQGAGKLEAAPCCRGNGCIKNFMEWRRSLNDFPPEGNSASTGIEQQPVFSSRVLAFINLGF